ncbi:hypothetical protein [Streptomyces sp. NPDC096324]
MELLGSREGVHHVHFVDDVLSPDTFAHPGVLWSTLTRLQALA